MFEFLNTSVGTSAADTIWSTLKGHWSGLQFLVLPDCDALENARENYCVVILCVVWRGCTGGGIVREVDFESSQVLSQLVSL